MKPNYILIDYENVQPIALAALNQEHIRIILFVGAVQSKIPFEVAAALQPFGTRVEYVKITGNGPNALDFHIAFYIGKLAASTPDAFFHIISKDTGFDPLIQHLKSQKIMARRTPCVEEIPMVQALQATSRSQRLEVVITNLEQRGEARPRTVLTLSNTINALFQQKLSEDEVAAILNDMQQQGIITVNNTKIAYMLATASK